MTEIAARSETAIGSLYRFFPTKEALAATLLRRFTERSSRSLDDLAARADALGGEELAEALIEWSVASKSDRLLKGERSLTQDEPTGARRRIRELRRLLRQYVVESLNERA